MSTVSPALLNVLILAAIIFLLARAFAHWWAIVQAIRETLRRSIMQRAARKEAALKQAEQDSVRADKPCFDCQSNDLPTLHWPVFAAWLCQNCAGARLGLESKASS